MMFKSPLFAVCKCFNVDKSTQLPPGSVILCQNGALCPFFLTCLQYKSFENSVGKGEIARNEQFLLFP